MNKEQSVFIRLEPEMKQTLKTLAEDKGLNISTYCRMILFEKMKELKGSMPHDIRIAREKREKLEGEIK